MILARVSTGPHFEWLRAWKTEDLCYLIYKLNLLFATGMRRTLQYIAHEK